MFPPESSICTKCRHLMCQGPSPRVSNLDQRIPSQSLESSPNFACSDVTEVDCAHQSASAGHLYLSEVHLNPQRQLRPNRTSRKCHTNLLNMFRLITTQTHQIFKMSQCNSLLILLILLLSITSQVSCLGIFEIRLDEFVNELNRDASGMCCDHNTTDFSNNRQTCVEKCQTYFRVCFKNYQANIDTNSACLYGEKKIHPVNSASPLNLSIKFPFEFSWPGTFSLIIEAWNNGSASVHTKDAILPRLISRSFESRPNRLKVSNEWTQKVSRINHTTLHYSYRVMCNEHYYQESCTHMCRPRNDTHGHYTCLPNGERRCLEGWTGGYCQEPVCRFCNTSFGTCKSPGVCECRLGYEGEDCSKCSTYPACKNGYCNEPGQCLCKEGWGGLLCDMDLNYCTNHRPCLNGGNCSNTGMGLFTCQCPVGFSGNQCEIVVDSCEHSPCLNGGTCKSHSTINYTCECPLGYNGLHCEQSVSSCANNPCENEGSCVDGPSGYLCMCKRGFSGKKCKVSQKGCNPNPCLNDANCVQQTNSSLDNADSYICQCRAGFSGHHCEVNINDCESNPCLNSGTCVDEINSFRCLCVSGFDGELCQKNVDECLLQPCANGGTCIDRDNDYMCVCPLGFSGKDCSMNINDCASNPCQNGGSCIDRVNEFTCLCPPNFSGAQCEFGDNSIYLDSSSAYSAIKTNNEEDENVFSSTQLLFIIFGSISLPLIAIIISIVWILCKHWKNYDNKVKSRRDEDEARRQNEHNAVMSSMNNKCFDQCLNPSAAKVIVNSLDRPASMYHLNKCHNNPKVTNEYVYGRQLDKCATLQKGFKVVNTNKVINTDYSTSMPLDDPYSHTYEHIQKPNNYLSSNLTSDYLYQSHSPKQSNLNICEKLDIYTDSAAVKLPNKASDCLSMTPSLSSDLIFGSNDVSSKPHSSLQNNIQIAATLQRMGCRSNSIYVIEDHYSQPIYGDPKKLHATEV